MRRVRQFIALLLLAVWLPVTQHCGLEAAGLVSTCCDDDGCSSGQSCSKDDCVALESGLIRSTNGSVQVPAPVECACRDCLAFAAVALAPAREVLPPDRVYQPDDWVPIWSFVRRTAPPSRAPALLLA